MATRGQPDAFVAPTFGQRLGGRALDGVVLLPAFFLLTALAHGAAFRIWAVAIGAAYDIGGVAIWGRTFGKRIVGTRVAGFSSEPVQPWQAVVRFMVYGAPTFVFAALGLRFVADLCVLIVVLPVLRPPLHRGLHDFAAGTIVVPTSPAGPHLPL